MFLVVLSYPRSGSTLVQRMLNTADGVVVRGENVGAIASLAEAYGKLKRVKFELPEIVKTEVTWDGSPLFGADRIDLDGIRAVFKRVVSQQILAQPEDCKIVGWKENFVDPTVFGSLNARLLLSDLEEMLRDVKFVVHLRNPETTAKSAVWRQSDESLGRIQLWHDWLVKWVSKQPVDRCVAIQYETLIESPNIAVESLKQINLHVSLVETKKILQQRLTHLQEW